VFTPLDRIVNLARALAQSMRGFRLPEPPPADGQVETEVPCCSELVHVAFRGVSDDRLYLSYNRKWTEVKYFRKNGLRVFCAVCRRRVY